MAITRKEGSPFWWIDFTVGGKRIRQSAGTSDRRLAQEYHDKLKAESWKQKNLGEKPRYRWTDAVVRYLREEQLSGKKSIAHDISTFRWLDPYLRDKHLDQIDRRLVDCIIAARLKPYSMVYKNGHKRKIVPGVEAVNRFLTSFRALLNRACHEWEWIDRAPKIKALKGSKSRMRWITREEANKLIAALPAHLADMAEFSLQTGLRRANVTYLEWNQIDLQRKTAWVTGDKTKNKKALAVPLTDVAIKLLEKWSDVHPRWVFTFRGAPVHQTSTNVWRSILAEVGIANFRWHDLRHTWASWHVQNGTPLHVLQELGGWSSLKMVQRYAHLSGEHLREWVDRLDKPELRLIVNNGSIADAPRHNLDTVKKKAANVAA